MKHFKALATAATLLASPLAAQTPGVSDTEIKIGGAHDLSGIFAPFSVPAVAAARAYFDQVNAAGACMAARSTTSSRTTAIRCPRRRRPPTSW
ncbi:hypothetical protein ACFSZS_01640 [Seohaeicola zhoushanensis]